MKQNNKKVTWEKFREETTFTTGIMLGYFMGGILLFVFGLKHKDITELVMTSLLFIMILISFWQIEINYKEYKGKK